MIGATALGLASAATIGYFVTRDKASSTPQAAASSSQGNTQSTASGGGFDPRERSQQVDAEAEQRAQTAESAQPENLAKGKGRSLAEMAANEEVDDTELISRFVMNTNGDQVGETMTITDGEVILKRPEGFCSVPPDAIIEKNGTLLADANIDWEKAREAGKAWEEENFDRMEYDETGMPQHG